MELERLAGARPFIPYANKYLLSVCSMPDINLGNADKAVDQIEKSPDNEELLKPG